MTQARDRRELLPELLFRRHGFGVISPLRNAHAKGFALSIEPSRQFRRLETVARSIAAGAESALGLRLPASSLTTIDGVDRSECECDIYEQVDSAAGHYSLPPGSLAVGAEGEIDLAKVYSLSYWHIRLPRHHSLRLNASHASIEVANMDGPISVVSSHALLSLIDNTSAIRAAAADGGHIVWSGVGAKTDLRADLSIDLNLQHKPGVVPSVTACANGDVRLRLPESGYCAIGVYARDQRHVVNRTSGRIDFLGAVEDGYSRFERTTGQEIVLGSVQGSVLVEHG
jgi:hypothetical protein